MNKPKDRVGEGLDVDLYWADVIDLDSDQRQQIQALMSDEELQRWRRFRHEPSSLCYLVTRRLVRRTLSILGERRSREWRFGAGEHGRPFLKNPTPSLHGIDFNIAHSRQKVVLAITTGGRVGVDLEPVDRRVDHELVAEKFFHDDERRALERLDGAGRRRRFLELWVLKEAWMKADGRGIGAGLSEVVFAFDANGNPELVSLPGARLRPWTVTLGQVDDHLVALARRREDVGDQL